MLGVGFVEASEIPRKEGLQLRSMKRMEALRSREWTFAAERLSGYIAEVQTFGCIARSEAQGLKSVAKVFWSANASLVGGLDHFLFFHILGMSSSQLTHIFQRG
jgi:hypothetical protein